MWEEDRIGLMPGSRTLTRLILYPHPIAKIQVGQTMSTSFASTRSALMSVVRKSCYLMSTPNFVGSPSRRRSPCLSSKTICSFLASWVCGLNVGSLCASLTSNSKSYCWQILLISGTLAQFNRLCDGSAVSTRIPASSCCPSSLTFTVTLSGVVGCYSNRRFSRTTESAQCDDVFA
jgi:hypothetical protein